MGNTDIEDALKRLDKLTQEEVRMATAQLLKITHDVKSSSVISPNPGHVFTPDPQEASGDRTFESGSRLQIHPQIKLSCAELSTKEPQTGSSGAVFSRNGSPSAHCSGSMASVRHSPSHAAPISDLSFHYSGLREERHLVSHLVCLRCE